MVDAEPTSALSAAAGRGSRKRPDWRREEPRHTGRIRDRRRPSCSVRPRGSRPRCRTLMVGRPPGDGVRWVCGHARMRHTSLFRLPTKSPSRISRASSLCPTSSNASVASCPPTSSITSSPPLCDNVSFLSRLTSHWGVRRSISAAKKSILMRAWQNAMGERTGAHRRSS